MNLYTLPVGQGVLALSPIPGGQGDYVSDVQLIKAWAPAIVVSLVTEQELVAAGAAGLWQDLAGVGARWEHLPISDFGVPDDAFEEAWPDMSQDIKAALMEGARVLVHCRGGCGRSGMIALRVMIDLGESAEAALARLRSTRPCAVETDAQMNWALRTTLGRPT